MKKDFCVAFILASIACGSVFALGSLPSTEVYASLSFGSLIEGFQKDIPGQFISPAPNSYSMRVATVGIREFAFGVIGIEGSFGFLGSTAAKWTDVTKPLEIYDFEVFTLGLMLRLPLMLDLNSAITVFAGGGGTYTLLGFSSSFTYPFEALGSHFDNIDPDFGWYGKLGIGFYLSRSFFFDVSAYYSFLNAKYSGQQLGGTYFFIALAFGVAF